jgi:hypothetical protein
VEILDRLARIARNAAFAAIIHAQGKVTYFSEVTMISVHRISDSAPRIADAKRHFGEGLTVVPALGL